ncbi:serine-rich adhesin for platelets [Penaeus vannamei]|uniref:serine-rich adhesin for platelets n=1 Tax=Penaeus vannamei TaxID=6689 RepID=UPI00387F3F4F
MESKNKSSKKRRHEQTEFVEEEEEGLTSEVSVAGTKRRKKSKEGIRHKSSSTKLTNTDVNAATSTDPSSEIHCDQSGNAFSCDKVGSLQSCLVTASCDNDQNLASYVKKTYSSGMKNRSTKKERSRTRSLRHRYSNADLVINENVKDNGTAVEKAVDTELEERLSAVSGLHIEGRNAQKQGRDNTEERNDSNINEDISNSNLATQVMTKHVEFENISCLNSNFNNTSEIGKVVEKKIESGNSPNSLPYSGAQPNTEHQGISVGNVNVLATISSNIPVSLGSRVVHTSAQNLNAGFQVMPNLEANTSSTETNATTVVTHPQLSFSNQDGSDDMPLTLDFERSGKTNQSCSAIIPPMSSASFNHESQDRSDFCGHNRNLKVEKGVDSLSADFLEQEKKTIREGRYVLEQELHKDSIIPLVDLEEGGADPLMVEKENSPTLRNNNTTNATKQKKGENIQVSTGGQSQVTTSSLRVDNWGAYLLQRLEVLFDQEQECDLTLKFSTGEVLKVHRTIVSACTSLVSEPHTVERSEEFAMPPELNYASVEPVIRFIYSGRLDVRGSRSEMTAIYNAAQRLQVSLLTRLMDRRFPYLTPSRNSANRLPVWRRTPDRQSRHQKQQPSKAATKGSIPRVPTSPTTSSDKQHKSFSDDELQARTSPDILEISSKEIPEGAAGSGPEEEEEAGDGIYLLVTNSQKIAQANAAVRRKRPAEQARPTRFELEEESENASVKIATWSSKSSNVPSFFPSTSIQGQEPTTAFLSSTHTTSADSSDLQQKFVNVTTSGTVSSPKCNSVSPSSDGLTGSSPTSRQCVQPHDQYTFMSHTTSNDPAPSHSAEDDAITVIEDVPISLNARSKGHIVGAQENENIVDDDAGRDGDDLMEKISNICRQLEDRDSDDSESNLEESFESSDNSMNFMHSGSCVTSDCSSHTPDDLKNESLGMHQSSTSVKSILKRKKDKNKIGTKKRVSFPLDENDELINEVATYSHSKEPSQSLLDVQKTVGSFRSSEDVSSPVKLTLSLKKKVLVNLALGESETSESQSSHRNVKNKNKKDSNSPSQSTSQGVSQGDMSNHAKIISEVLKKYPHLVKDKKNIRLKILKKGNDKAGSGKLVKSKVQYLVLSENESKAKPGSKLSKSPTSSVPKGDSSTTRGAQSSQTFDCPECRDLSFTTYFAFKKHVLYEHKDKSSAILANVESVPYACFTCFLNEPLEFSDYCSYQQHMKDVHSKSEARLCSICGFRPGRKLELAYHLYTEHNKTPRNITFPKCDLCDHVAMTEAALLKHRSQHANADNYTCSVCGVAFRSFGALQGHMQTKLCQNKPSISHKCPYCPQTFARSYNLKAHCKSNHRALHNIAQTSTGCTGEQTTEVQQQEERTLSSNDPQNVPDRSLEERSLSVEGMCETLTSINSHSSSEAEALSTVASSLAASLGLPEESMTQYMYTQGSKLDFPGSLEGDKYEEGMNRPSSVSVHLVEASTPVSGYPGDMTVCHDRTYTCQAQMPSTTSVGTLYPVGVVPSQIVPGQMVPGQLLPSHVLPGNCVSVAGGSVIGAAPHSWTYVTYQVPTTSDDIPVMTEATTLTPSSVHPDHNATVEVTMSGKSTNSNNGITSSCEDPNPLVMITSPTPQVNISQSSQLSATQSYDTFSSQFV